MTASIDIRNLIMGNSTEVLVNTVEGLCGTRIGHVPNLESIGIKLVGNQKTLIDIFILGATVSFYENANLLIGKRSLTRLEGPHVNPIGHISTCASKVLHQPVLTPF